MSHHPHLSHPSDSEDFFSPDPRNRIPSLPPAPPSNRSDYAINLSILTRYVPSAHSIIDRAPYAVVYVYGAGSEGKEPGWEKTGVEGSVFVLQLTNNEGKDGYAVMVLNRRGLDNWVLHLRSKEGVQLTPEYIILEGTGDDEDKIFGLWVFEEPDKSTSGLREQIGKCLMECAEESEGMGQDEQVNEAQPVSQGNGTNGQSQGQRSYPGDPDLMAILNPPRAPAPQQLDSNHEVNLVDRFFRNPGGMAP